MKKLTTLLRAIESIPGLMAVRAEWADRCGTDFPRIERFLVTTTERAERYPCPHPTGYDCPRLIVGEESGPFEAICHDPRRLCPDLTISGNDVLIHGLDLPGIMKPILAAAGIKNPQLESRSAGVWNAGLAVGRGGLQPAYLLVLASTEEFAQAASCLALDVQGPLTIMALTSRHWTGELRERLSPPRIMFIGLDDKVGLDDAGEVVAIGPAPAEVLRNSAPKKAGPKRGGRPVASKTNEIFDAWIAMGSPALDASVCAELAKTAYPDQWKTVRRGTPAHKALRDRVRGAVQRAERRHATKPIS